MNNNDDHIVKPELVDMSKVQVVNNDNLLNRERDNIVNASIQANQAINKDMAVQVNNQIHIDNKMNKKKMSIIIVSLLVLLVGAIIFFILFSNFLKNDKTDEITTTTISNNSLFNEKLNNKNALRRFEGTNYVLMLLPDNFGKYLLLNKITNMYTYGTFTKDKSINLVENLTNITNTVGINNDSLLLNDCSLSYNDSEYKYFESEESFLLINATEGLEKAMYYFDGNYIITDFVESSTSISLSTGTLFSKTNDGINLNGVGLKQAD